MQVISGAHPPMNCRSLELLQATKDQYVRLNADFENFRKRTATEKDALRTSVKGDTVMVRGRCLLDGCGLLERSRYGAQASRERRHVMLIALCASNSVDGPWSSSTLPCILQLLSLPSPLCACSRPWCL